LFEHSNWFGKDSSASNSPVLPLPPVFDPPYSPLPFPNYPKNHYAIASNLHLVFPLGFRDYTSFHLETSLNQFLY
jgi:hypothetical protein